MSAVVADLNQTWQQFEIAMGKDPANPSDVVTDVETRAYLRHENIDLPFGSEKPSRVGWGMTFHFADQESRQLAGMRDGLLIQHDGYDRTMREFGVALIDVARHVHQRMLAAKDLVEVANVDDIKNGTIDPTRKLQGLSEDMHRELATLHKEIMDYAALFGKWRGTIEEMVGNDPDALAKRMHDLQLDRQDYLRQRFGVTKDANGNEHLRASMNDVVADAVKNKAPVLFNENHFDPKAAATVRQQLERNLDGVKGLAYEMPEETWPAYQKYLDSNHTKDDMLALRMATELGDSQSFKDHLATLEYAYKNGIPIKFIDNRLQRLPIQGSSADPLSEQPELDPRSRMELSDAPMAKEITDFAKERNGTIFVMLGAAHGNTYDTLGYLPDAISISTDSPFDPKSAAKPGRVLLAPERLAPYSDFRDNMNPTVWVQSH